MSNPYAPPRAVVQDFIGDPDARREPAGRGTRLGAAFIDSIVFFVMVYVPLMAAGMFNVPTDEAPTPAEGLGAMLGVVTAFVGLIAYCWITLVYMRRNGQSIGKKLLAIKVVRSDGSPASLARLIWLRNVLNWIISLIPIYVLIDVLFIFGEPRQCLHDKLADTIVVKV